MSFGAVQVEPLIPDRPKERDQTKRDTRVYTMRGRSIFTSGTRLYIRRDRGSERGRLSWHQHNMKGFDIDNCLSGSEPDSVTPEKDPISLKKAELRSAQSEGARYRANYLPGPREPFMAPGVTVGESFDRLLTRRIFDKKSKCIH